MARKYWDIIPPKKKTGHQDRLEKIQEFFEKESKRNREVMPYRMPFTPQIGGCLHKNCSTCHGSGYSPYGGFCVHMISCPCPSCSPKMMMSVTGAGSPLSHI